MDKPEMTATDAGHDERTPDMGTLGDAGTRALKAEREARKAAENALKNANERIAALEGADVRREIASDKGLTAAQARYLTGSTREELAASADELLAAFGTTAEPTDRMTDYRPPKEDLRPGASNPEELDGEFAAMAERIIRQ